MNRPDCKSIETTATHEDSDIESAKLEVGAIELYPAPSKTISLSLKELRGAVREIEALNKAEGIPNEIND